MSPPRSFRWSRPAAWPTWSARCRRRWPRPGADVRAAAAGPAGDPRRGAAPEAAVEIGACFGAGARHAAARAHAGQPRAGLRDRRALPVPARRQPLPGRRRQRVARQPAALRPARLGGGAPGRRRARPGLGARRPARPRLARGDGLRLHGRAPAAPARPRSSPCTTWPTRACSRSTTARCSACLRASCVARRWSSTASSPS